MVGNPEDHFSRIATNIYFVGWLYQCFVTHSTATCGNMETRAEFKVSPERLDSSSIMKTSNAINRDF